jgi:hypothetical protein
MTDILRTIAADLLEAPEEATKLMGQALKAAGAELQKLSDRIGALEDKARGQ